MTDAPSMQELQSLQRRLQALDRNLATLEQSMQELTTAIATLEGLEGDEDVAAWVPAGAGIRVHARVHPAAKVLVELGRGNSTEMSKADALSHLRDRLTRTESAFRTTSEEADKTAERMQRLQIAQAASSDSSS